jgi:tetratricopeptide (TPR) repeat protein
VTDAKEFAHAHPDLVRSYETADGARYKRQMGTGPATVGESLALLAERDTEPPSPEREDAIALELVALLEKPSADRGVEDFLQRVLPDQCAGGTGKGIEALRARAGSPEIDTLLARALSARARQVPRNDLAGLREAISLFEASDDRAAAAEARGRLAAALEKSGDLQAATAELEQVLAEHRSLALKNVVHGRFIGVTLLNLGRLYGLAGRRREAKQATKAAIAEFRLGASGDRHTLANLSRAKQQLSRLRWRR